MMIDADVRRIATEFNLDPKLVQSVVKQEGDIVRAVQCSVPDVTTREQAIRILCLSLVHRLWEFAGQRPGAFVAYFGSKWAPYPTANDPKGLNRFFVPNVLQFWTES